eukprot:superscaffoldBa00000300_g3607
MQLERERKIQLVALTEELKERNRALDGLKEQVTSLTESEPLMTDHCQHTAVSPSQNTQQDDPLSQPEQPESSSHTDGPDSPTAKAHIVLLIDSNGKFIVEKRLFLGHKVAKLWSPNTVAAMGILCESHLGSASHILIHTERISTNKQYRKRMSASPETVNNSQMFMFPTTPLLLYKIFMIMYTSSRKQFHSSQRHIQSAQISPRPRTSPPPRSFALPPPQQQQEQTQPGRPSYSKVVRGAAGSTDSELRAILDMLSTLCSHLGATVTVSGNEQVVVL